MFAHHSPPVDFAKLCKVNRLRPHLQNWGINKSAARVQRSGCPQALRDTTARKFPPHTPSPSPPSPRVTRDTFHQHLPPTNTRSTSHHDEQAVEAGIKTTARLRQSLPADIYMDLPLPEHAARWKGTRPQASRPRTEDDTHTHTRSTRQRGQAPWTHCAPLCNSK